MPMTPLGDSSLFVAHGYDPDTQTMRLQFKNKGKPGDTYEYDGVSPEKYAAFTGANSHGAFFHKRIRPVHEGRKVK
jgi:hypothetical protein